MSYLTHAGDQINHKRVNSVHRSEGAGTLVEARRCGTGFRLPYVGSVVKDEKTSVTLTLRTHEEAIH